jgi:DNA-binding CsgD family transcriptional regulator
MEGARAVSPANDSLTNLNSRPGLVGSRWSMIDVFELNGNRYIVARENVPRPASIEALTLRERQIVAYAALGHDNKVIAYDLGIAHSTVKVLMARAANKIGAKSRSELIASYLTACKSPKPETIQPVDLDAAPSMEGHA